TSVAMFLFLFMPIALLPSACFIASFFFSFTGTVTTEIYTLSLHDALPIWQLSVCRQGLTRGWLGLGHARMAGTDFCSRSGGIPTDDSTLGQPIHCQPQRHLTIYCNWGGRTHSPRSGNNGF